MSKVADAIKSLEAENERLLRKVADNKILITGFKSLTRRRTPVKRTPVKATVSVEPKTTTVRGKMSITDAVIQFVNNVKSPVRIMQVLYRVQEMGITTSYGTIARTLTELKKTNRVSSPSRGFYAPAK